MIDTHKGYVQELTEFLAHIETQIESGKVTGVRYTHLRGSLYQIETFQERDDELESNQE